MTRTTDPAQRVRNAQFLRGELAGTNGGLHPMKISYRNPQQREAALDKSFAGDLASYMNELDDTIATMLADLSAGRPVMGLPPVRASFQETIRNSGSGVADLGGAQNSQPTIGKLAQHLMSRVLGPMEENIEADRRTLQTFLRRCG